MNLNNCVLDALGAPVVEWYIEEQLGGPQPVGPVSFGHPIQAVGHIVETGQFVYFRRRVSKTSVLIATDSEPLFSAFGPRVALFQDEDIDRNKQFTREDVDAFVLRHVAAYLADGC